MPLRWEPPQLENLQPLATFAKDLSKWTQSAMINDLWISVVKNHLTSFSVSTLFYTTWTALDLNVFPCGGAAYEGQLPKCAGLWKLLANIVIRCPIWNSLQKQCNKKSFSWGNLHSSSTSAHFLCQILQGHWVFSRIAEIEDLECKWTGLLDWLQRRYSYQFQLFGSNFWEFSELETLSCLQLCKTCVLPVRHWRINIRASHHKIAPVEGSQCSGPESSQS